MTIPNTNYFTHDSAAQRYARSRPYFHPLVIEKIKEHISVASLLPLALDAACGTGQSSLAATGIAAEVIGTDISGEMLREAARQPNIHYVQASSEQLPFASGVFELITVALAFHWFDRELFLDEARRVLKPRGWLVLYNNFFLGIMAENPEFMAWSRSVYLARYPTPPRNNAPITEEGAAAHGFTASEQERYRNSVQFTLEELAAYLMTQSNVIAAVENGSESEEEIYSWLMEALKPLFPQQVCTFQFSGTIDYLQKA